MVRVKTVEGMGGTSGLSPVDEDIVPVEHQIALPIAKL